LKKKIKKIRIRPLLDISSLYCQISATSNSTYGGSAYGSLYEPNLTGSQGGTGSSGTAGGRGGGKAKITVGAIMIADGSIEADGGDGSNLSGGGSGGSIWIIVGTYTTKSDMSCLFFKMFLLLEGVKE